MVFTDFLLDTLRTLWAHKLRTFLTMFGIAWGIISITLMVAAGEGLRVGQQRQQETFAKDLMIFFDGRTSMQAGGLRAGREVRWTATDVLRHSAGSHRLPLRLAGTRARRHEGPQPLQQCYAHCDRFLSCLSPKFAPSAWRRGGSTIGAMRKRAAAWLSSAATSRNSSFPAARPSARRSSSTTFLIPSSGSWQPKTRTRATTAGTWTRSLCPSAPCCRTSPPSLRCSPPTLTICWSPPNLFPTMKPVSGK